MKDRSDAVFTRPKLIRQGLVLAWAGFLCLTTFAASATPVGADAVVLVNSASARYLDFRNYIQPYLDHFGVPYTVLDIVTNAVGTNLGDHAVIIVGHNQLDTNHVYLDAAEQGIISLAVSNGTGLVNFDNVLSGSGVSSNYTYVQDIFGFGYTNPVSATTVTFPTTETNSQLHYITALHTNTGAIGLSNNMTLAGLLLPTNVTAVVLGGGQPLVAVTKAGAGRAVQWAGYDWIKVSVKGPMFGLDDLVWRSLVWAARKPFVLRGMPNHVVLRVDDVAGPTAAASSSTALTNWVRIATEIGFKPHLELFYNCLDAGEISVIRNVVTNGQATASIHSQGCGGGSFFFFDHEGKKSWPDNVMQANFEAGTNWLQVNGIPHSKVICPHYSELGTNIFAGLKNYWGVEYTSIEIIPGQVEYPNSGPGAPWLVGGPYRLYETPLEGRINLPFFYADYLPIPNHPELNGQFFNVYTEIRDDSDCHEWCPDNNVANSVGMGVRQLKRSFDNMALATLYTHDYYFYPTVDNGSMASTGPITTNNWRSILQGITNAIAGYNPQYVTIDYACQYVRATRTAKIVSADFDPVSGRVGLALTGKADLSLQTQVFFGEDNGITNKIAAVPAFTNNFIISIPVANALPAITNQPQNQTAIAGSNVTFTVGAFSDTLLSFQWRCNSTNLPDGTNASLTLASVQATNAGDYSVIVSNLAGSVLSSNALLTVIVPPSLTLQPHDLTVGVGSTAKFTVNATGTEPFAYQWFLGGTNIVGAAAPAYYVTEAQLTNAGNYSVMVSNLAGWVISSNALLTVLLPPAITNDLPSQTVPAGTNVVLALAATGSEPLSYHWFKDATNLVSTLTNALTLINVQPADAGVYTVVVTNAAGSATSAVAVLTVTLDAPFFLRGRVQSNLFVISFNSISGQTYRVEYQSRVGDASWSVLTNLTAVDTTTVCFDSLTAAQRVYRAILNPTPLPPLAPVLQISVQSNLVLLSFNSISGQTYRVEYKNSVSDTSWSVLTNLTAVDATTVCTDVLTGTQRVYRAIINPTSTPLPVPPVLQINVESNLVVLSFNSILGQSYRIEYTETLGAGSWSVLTNLTAVDTNTVAFHTLGAVPRYYRVVVLSSLPSEPIRLAGRLQGNQFVLSFNALAGSNYTIEYAGAIGLWSPLTNFTALGTNATFADPLINTQRFYRVRVPAN